MTMILIKSVAEKESNLYSLRQCYYLSFKITLFHICNEAGGSGTHTRTHPRTNYFLFSLCNFFLSFFLSFGSSFFYSFLLYNRWVFSCKRKCYKASKLYELSTYCMVRGNSACCSVERSQLPPS